MLFHIDDGLMCLRVFAVADLIMYPAVLETMHEDLHPNFQIAVFVLGRCMQVVQCVTPKSHKFLSSNTCEIQANQ